jgi:hypothetical protein
MHPDAARLFALDEALRAEADRMLADSGIGAILADAGYAAVGSYPMRTMTWRDLDFELPEDSPQQGIKWDFGSRLAATGWCVRLQFEDFYRQRLPGPLTFRPAPGSPATLDGVLRECGLYWGARVVDPRWNEPVDVGGRETWKLDMWSAPSSVFAVGSTRRQEWDRLLTGDARSYVLAIKEVVCHEPEYRKTMLSVHIYDAVLEHGIRDMDAFRAWWEKTRP